MLSRKQAVKQGQEDISRNQVQACSYHLMLLNRICQMCHHSLLEWYAEAEVHIMHDMGELSLCGLVFAIVLLTNKRGDD